MMTRLFAVFVAGWMMATAAIAQQEQFFIQVEARSSLTGAQASVREFTQAFSDVNGFALGGGWYGVALGPFTTRGQAEQRLRALRQDRLVPGDSYVETSGKYRQQFWPVGAASQSVTPSPLVPSVTEAARPSTGQGQDVDATQGARSDPEETQRQAQASERALTRAQREELQIALRWAGLYSAGIDGAFGRGTRGAMAAWQRENGVDATGVLTTRQRAALLGQYYAPLEGMGMAPYSDPRIGISIDLPLQVVNFARYEAPFAIFDASDGDKLAARVLLISQPGDARTLGGLYEIMQTLEIVPLEGERQRRRDGFVLTGANDRIVSHTEVRLQGGNLKGFALVWPAGDEQRRTRVLERMQASFVPTDGVLDPAQVTDEGQQVDLVSGLKVRKPRLSASGFFVDAGGAVLTSAAVVQNCGRVTLDADLDAIILDTEEALGIAVLRPRDRIAPRSFAAFRSTTPRLQSEIAVGGFSFGGVLGAPSLTYGTLTGAQGLGGEEGLKRLALKALPGDAGGPVFDADGGVLGMLLPRDDSGGRRLPDGVSFAAKSAGILPVLSRAGIVTRPQPGGAALDPEDLTRLAAGMTVLVSCWE